MHISQLFHVQVFSAAMLAILFLQSGVDKLFHWKEEMVFQKQHFSKTFLRSTVPFMLVILTILELVAGFSSAIGVVMLFAHQGTTWAVFGAVISGITLIALFFGQRIAKDYAGAVSIVTYFILAMVALYANGCLTY